jgi:hypothetical protein
VYSAESPPRQRSLVLVDAVDGKVVEHLTEDNPEDDWLDNTTASETDPARLLGSGNARTSSEDAPNRLPGKDRPDR